MKYTYLQFKAQYANDDACLDSIMKRRYPEGSACEGCGVVPAKFHRITGRRGYACQDCGHHTYPCAGTIFEHSSTTLTLWFHAMYLMTATRNGVSAKELQRQLGVTYKCAWRIGHQLRLLMSARDKANTPEKLSDHVEIDETYIGGKKRTGKRRGPQLQHKTAVMGLVQRGGAFKGHVVPGQQENDPAALRAAGRGSRQYTDTLSAYKSLSEFGYKHVALNHTEES